LAAQPQKQTGMPQPIPPMPLGGGLKVAIALVLVVAIVVAVVAVALIAGWFGGSKPAISFSGSVVGGSSQNLTATWTVSSASQSHPFSSYKVSMSKDQASIGSAQTLAGNRILSLGGSVYLIVQDAEADGKLTVGDAVMVYGMTGSHSWAFKLLWNDGSEITAKTWMTGSSISMGINISRSADGTNWILAISSASSGLTTSGTYLTVFKPDGSTNLTKTAFASLSYATHGAQYAGDGDMTVEVGERVLLHTSWYSSGCTVQISTDTHILYNGVLS